MRRLGQPAWFQIGDRDLSTHLTRTHLLREGKTLSEATTEITKILGIESIILPMTNTPVETRVTIPEGEISFQDYFVRRRYRDPVKAVRFAGAESATPASGVREAILSASCILLAPSNPITSIGPVLALPGISDALRETSAPVSASTFNVASQQGQTMVKRSELLISSRKGRPGRRIIPAETPAMLVKRRGLVVPFY